MKMKGIFIYLIFISSVDALEKLKNAEIGKLDHLKGERFKIHKEITQRNVLGNENSWTCSSVFTSSFILCSGTHFGYIPVYLFVCL